MTFVLLEGRVLVEAVARKRTSWSLNDIRLVQNEDDFYVMEAMFLGQAMFDLGPGV